MCVAHNSEIITLRIRQTFLLDDRFARDAEPPKPARAEALYWDSKEPGFLLRVLASGGRSWAVETLSKNKKRTIAVKGRCDRMGVDEARELARKEKAAATRGQSQAQRKASEREERRKSVPSKATLTVRQLSVKWMAWGTSDPEPWERETTARQYDYALKRHILPEFGGKPVDAIEPGAAQLLYDAVEQTSRGDALNVFAALRAMYNYGIKRGLVKIANPASTKLVDVTDESPAKPN